MKKTISLVLFICLSFSACVRKSETRRYKKESKEYIFFKTLSAKTPLLDPDNPQDIITTKQFTLKNTDILPRFYAISRRQPNAWQDMQTEVLINYVHQIATQETEKRLLLASAKAAGIHMPKDSIESQFKKYAVQQGGIEAYANYLTQYGLTIDLVKKDIHSGLIIDQFIKNDIFKNISVSEEDLKNAYAEEKFVSIRQIVMGISGKKQAQVDSIQKKMEEIFTRAKKGENFAKLADQYSEDQTTKKKGGLYENVPRHAMVQSFEKVVFNLPIGGISEVLRTPDGLYIVKVEKRSKETRPFEQIKDNLRTELTQFKQRNTFTAFVDSLKTKYQFKDLHAQAL